MKIGENSRVICGDALIELKNLPSESIDCCITSPPYWGLRDYGTAKWEDGDASCDHIEKKSGMSDKNTLGTTGHLPQTNSAVKSGEIQYKSACVKCGAKRIDNQLGLEKTPEEYVANLVNVFREVRRVLKKDGTLWLNLGDSYMSGGGASRHHGYTDPKYKEGRKVEHFEPQAYPHKIIKPKDLVGIPWMTAFALRADGWYLRSDIIWAKPNPMPESVTDRPTKSHEYVFLMSKSQKYYYDYEAIKEKAAIDEQRPAGVVRDRLFDYDSKEKAMGKRKGGGPIGGVQKARVFGAKEQLGTFRQDVGNVFIDNGKRNKRSVWTVATNPFKEAHFATFPEDLITPMVLAGCPKGGTILDPFFGAGTTGLVAVKYGRKYIGIELNKNYCDMAEKRIEAGSRQGKLF